MNVRILLALGFLFILITGIGGVMLLDSTTSSVPNEPNTPTVSPENNTNNEQTTPEFENPTNDDEYDSYNGEEITRPEDLGHNGDTVTNVTMLLSHHEASLVDSKKFTYTFKNVKKKDGFTTIEEYAYQRNETGQFAVAMRENPSGTVVEYWNTESDVKHLQFAPNEGEITYRNKKMRGSFWVHTGKQSLQSYMQGYSYENGSYDTINGTEYFVYQVTGFSKLNKSASGELRVTADTGIIRYLSIETQADSILYTASTDSDITVKKPIWIQD